MPLKFLAHKRLSKRIRPRFTWKDVKLPEPQIEILTDILEEIKPSGKQGLKKKPVAKKGMNIMFTGNAGKNQLRAASMLAKKGNLKLFRVDLGAVVSKYIGETEKNLAKLLSRAEQHDWILFFDEADALFGKRTKVKDSHDRFANREREGLIKQLESYSGVAILASNNRKTIDENFSRKVDYVIDFPDPDK